MAINGAFMPTGKTVQVTASNAAVNNVTMYSDSPSGQYRLASHGNHAVYVWISTTANPINVAAPTGNGNNAAYSIMIPPGTVSVISGPQCSSSTGVQVSVIAENDSPEIYVTPGEGIN